MELLRLTGAVFAVEHRLLTERKRLNLLDAAADGDTGANLAATVTLAARELSFYSQSQSGAALCRALTAFSCGMSGKILAAAASGLLSEINGGELTAEAMSRALCAAAKSAHGAVSSPADGKTALFALDYFARQSRKSKAKSARGLLGELCSEARELCGLDAGGHGILCVMHGLCDALSLQPPLERLMQETARIEPIDLKKSEFFLELVLLRTVPCSTESLKAALSESARDVRIIEDCEHTKITMKTVRASSAVERCCGFGKIVSLKLSAAKYQTRGGSA